MINEQQLFIMISYFIDFKLRQSVCVDYLKGEIFVPIILIETLP